MAKKKRGVPWMALGFGALAVGLGVRGLYRSTRSVLLDGFIEACPGDNDSCSPFVQLRGSDGATQVFNLTSGRLASGAEFGLQQGVAVLSSLEPVVLLYDFSRATQLTQHVRPGPGVGVAIGQPLATADRVGFGVFEVLPAEDGAPARLSPLLPTAWLASRGMSPTHRGGGDGRGKWCAGGRTLEVPASLVSERPDGCGMELPEPAGFLFLPVSVQTVSG